MIFIGAITFEICISDLIVAITKFIDDERFTKAGEELFLLNKILVEHAEREREKKKGITLRDVIGISPRPC